MAGGGRKAGQKKKVESRNFFFLRIDFNFFFLPAFVCKDEILRAGQASCDHEGKERE